MGATYRRLLAGIVLVEPTVQNRCMEHKGWRSRGYLPHCDGATLVQHVVFGLADAFPGERGDESVSVEVWLDDGHGSCLLKGVAAEAVEDALLHFDGTRYGLEAWCVMPNHVHVLVATAHGWPLDRIVHSWKSFTANRVNKIVGRTGRLWGREYFDHFMRTDEELLKTRLHIEDNPVKAGLVNAATEWRWSSAWSGREQ